jgi:hypothetical protein
MLAMDDGKDKSYEASSCASLFFCVAGSFVRYTSADHLIARLHHAPDLSWFQGNRHRRLPDRRNNLVIVDKGACRLTIKGQRFTKCCVAKHPQVREKVLSDNRLPSVESAASARNAFRCSASRKIGESGATTRYLEAILYPRGVRIHPPRVIFHPRGVKIHPRAVEIDPRAVKIHPRGVTSPSRERSLFEGSLLRPGNERSALRTPRPAFGHPLPKG